jgi:hypothetical protein
MTSALQAIRNLAFVGHPSAGKTRWSTRSRTRSD